MNVGTGGAGKEQGLRAALLAVTDRHRDGQNAGFLRPAQKLAVVIVSDEDDCSDPAMPPAIIYTTGSIDRCHTAANAGAPPEGADLCRCAEAGARRRARDLTVAIIAGVDPVTKQPVAKLACNASGYGAFRYTAFAQGVKDAGGTPSWTTCARLTSPPRSTPSPVSSHRRRSRSPQAPADWRLLAVSVTRAAGSTAACTVGLDGDASAANADVVYAPPQAGRPASLTFRRGCLLSQGDDIHVQVLCAG